MATFKPIVSNYLKDDGTRNVVIYVYHRGKKRYPATNFYLTKEDLTKTGKIKNQLYIDSLNDILRGCRDLCNEKASTLGEMDVDGVVELVIHIIEGREKKDERFTLDFVKFGEDYIKKLEEQNLNNAKLYRVSLNNLIKFVGRDSIDVNEITTKFVKEWISWIRRQPPRPGRKKGGRAESLYPSTIRSLHNEAKGTYNDEENGVINIPYSPFKKAVIPGLPAKKDRDLSVEEIRALFALKDVPSSHVGTNKFNFARDMFMLSFMLIGMNLADLYNCTDYTGGRINYRRTKVMNRRRDGGFFSVKVEPEALPLVEKYRDPTGERVFRFHKMYASIETFTMAVNGRYRKGANNRVYPVGLKKVGESIGIKNLQHYSARHSWATLTRNDVGVDKYTVHEALNHVEPEMKTTDIYLKKEWKLIDNANRATLNYVFLNILPLPVNNQSALTP